MDRRESHMVQLSKSYPQVFVQPLFLSDMNAHLGKKDPSFVFRRLVQVLIPEDTVWAQSNGSKDMFVNYDAQIGAAFEFVNSAKPNFTMRQCRQLLCQIIAETRRAMRIKLESTIHVASSTDEEELMETAKVDKENTKDDEEQPDEEVLEIEVVQAPKKTIRNLAHFLDSSSSSEDLLRMSGDDF